MKMKIPFGAETWPDKIKERVAATRSRRAAASRRTALHNCVLDLIDKGADPKSSNTAVKLYDLWGDTLDPARESFVRSCLMECENAEGHVLMSSASLMTLVLGAVSANDRNRTVWCLEQDQHWTNVMRSWLDQYAIKGTYVISAPPAVRGGLVHYKIDTKHLPRNIGLVMCDGLSASPSSTLSTLLSVSPHLAENFTVFARKVRLDEDGALLKRWAAKNDATFVVVNKRDGFVKISRRGREQYQGQDGQGRATYQVAG